jgi:hypothetical protein
MEVSEEWEKMEDVRGYLKAVGGRYRSTFCAYGFKIENPLKRCVIRDLALYWIVYRRATS